MYLSTKGTNLTQCRCIMPLFAVTNRRSNTCCHGEPSWTPQHLKVGILYVKSSFHKRHSYLSYLGERCLYGALTEDIRKLLLSRGLNKVIDPQSDFALFSYALVTNPLSHYADIEFRFSTTSVYAHRCILAARSTYFAAQLATRWKDIAVVPVKHPRVHVECFKAILLFLYTGQLARDIPAELNDNYLYIVKQWKLTELYTALTLEEVMTPLSNFRIRGANQNQNQQRKAQAVLIRDMVSVQRHLSVLFWWIVTGGNRWTIEGRYRHIGVTSDVMVGKFEDLRTRTTEEIKTERERQNEHTQQQRQAVDNAILDSDTSNSTETRMNDSIRRLRSSTLRPSNVAMAFLVRSFYSGLA